MSRFRADILLLLSAMIWGTTFIAQKLAIPYVGPYTFVAARFLVSMILILPLVMREYFRITFDKTRINKSELFLLCMFFSGGVILQQMGMKDTSVTNAGFLTGLYVIFVPLICKFLYREKLSPWIILAAILSVAGVWLLAGGQLDNFSRGDVYITACALCFSFQVAMLGRISVRYPAPFCITFLQFAGVFTFSAAAAVWIEKPVIADIAQAGWAILYAGLLSGAIGYTLQVVAQRHTPASDAGIIMSAEAVFAALAAALVLGERLEMLAYAGCIVIAAAILIVEAGPYIFGRRSYKKAKPFT